MFSGSKSEKQVTEVINTPLHGSTFETELRSIESRTTVLEAAVAEVLERLRNIEGEIGKIDKLHRAHLFYLVLLSSMLFH